MLGDPEPNYPSELAGGIRRFLVERGRDLDRWFLGARTIFAVGLVGFLSIDVMQGSWPMSLVVAILAAYVAANFVAWTTIGMRSAAVRWVYMAVDVAALLVVRHVFYFEMVVDPNATLVGFFTLFLLAYTIYGDPRLTAALAAAVLLATGGTLAADIAMAPVLLPEVAVYVDEPFRSVVLVGYLAAFCVITYVLSLRLRTHVVQHGLELLKRLEATVSSSVERSRREKIEELTRLKQDFISILSHELRTPLAPLRSSLDLMQRDDEEILRSELMDIALESTEKLQRLVLDYTQLAELLTDKEQDVVRWNFELRPFMDVLRDGSYFRNVHTAGFDGLTVCVDPKLLAAAVLALLRRARLVSSASAASLCGFAHSSGVTLSVHDPDSYIERDLSQILDDPFGHSCERTFVSENTGLELILARYALQRTGGTLRVTSSEQRGTTVYCTLPGERSGLERLDRSKIEYELESLLVYSVE